MKSRYLSDADKSLDNSENPISSFWFSSRWFLLIALLIWLSVIVTNGMVDSWGRLANGGENIIIFIDESLWPPDWSVIEPQAYPVCTEPEWLDFTCSTAWIGVIETLKIAFVSTIFGMIISLPLSLFAARNLNPWWISYPSRFILAASRSLPSIIWAIFFVILVGLGPLAGILAMTVYTIGYLGKLQYEAIEGSTETSFGCFKCNGTWLVRTFIWCDYSRVSKWINFSSHFYVRI